MDHIIRMAGHQDLDSIVKLLKKGKLNVEGLEKHIENFIVVEQQESQRIVGTAGLEVIEDKYGLLRSLVIDPACLDATAGMELLRILLAFSIQKGIQEIYFITLSTGFFEFFGCKKIDGVDVPYSVQRSQHYQQTKSDLSTVMVYKKGDKRGQAFLN